MAMELFFENLIKIEEAASSGLNLMKKEKGNPNLQFFLFLQKELDCNVVFTKGENDEDCPIMTDFINIPEVRDIYDNCRGDNAMLIVKGQNKNDSSKTGYVKLYVNQYRSQEILDKFPDAKKSGDKITFKWNDKEFIVQESGAEEKSEKRTAVEGKVIANYLDDKVLPSTKSQLNEFFRDLDIVYKEDKTIPNAIKSFVTYNKETSIGGVKNLVFEYSGKYSGTDNITYDIDIDTIEMLKDALLKIATDLGENYPEAVEKVFSGQLYGSGLRPEYIEGSAIVNLSKVRNISMPYKVEFYCSQHFPLVDFVALSDGKIYPYSVKDENGGNKSTCCRFLKAADKNVLFSQFEDFREAGFTEINNTLEKICANIDWGYRNVKLKGDKELEIGKEYPMGETVNKQADLWKNCDRDKVGGDVFNLGIYIASYLVKYSNRKDADFSLKNMPGRIFSHFRLGQNGERILKHNGKFILNQCEKVAVNIINQNRMVLDAIQNSIESFGVDTLGTPVIKIKPAAGGGFKEIEQSSKMRLRALASRGGGGKLGIIKNADGSVQVTEITTQGQGQFFGYEFEEK